MTQPLEENRLYSSWSRTPGKPSSSSNFINTKISNISSSTDSGVGRTPNWNSDSDNKFGVYDSNLWLTSNPLTSEIADNPKKLSWDENTNKVGNNFTFGFSSQWPTNNETTPWGLPRNNSSDFNVNDSNKLDNCWNNAQSNDGGPKDRFLTRSNSIWAANQIESNNSITTTANIDNNTVNAFQIFDPISKSSKNNNKSILTSESDKSEFPLFSAFNSSVVNDIGTIEDLNSSDGGNNDKNSEHQTWAQAAGKGLQTSVKDDNIKQEVDEQLQCLINRIDGWGSHTVDQSTPWVFENEICLDNNEKIGSVPSQRSRTNVESNVWTNEPPNGVGVWESHYENLGERTSRWGGGSINNSGSNVSSSNNNANAIINNQKANKAATGWEISPINDNAITSTQWTERDDNSVWSSNTNINAQHKQSWAMMSTNNKSDQQIISTPIGTGAVRSSVSSNMTPVQRNVNAIVPSIISGSVVSDINNDQINRHTNNFYNNNTTQNVNMMPSTRIAPTTKSKQMMNNNAFRKEDSQSSIFNNSMDMNRSFMDMKGSNLNHSGLMASRGDWNMPHENFRGNPVEPDNSVMLGAGGYMPQSMMPNNNINNSNNNINNNNNQPLKAHMMQHMQMSMNNRLPADNNHMLLEKQIISEITQLQSKQQDLMQRIHGLRSIAGSQAFIQEMTRTLNEVRQQLNTQQTTLKVIRSQMSMVNNQMPNGIMNNNNNNINSNNNNSNNSNQSTNNPLMSMVSRSMQPSASGIPSQSQSAGLVSDLSAQMNEMKLPKNRMDLWSQGSLPSPSTAISPYMGTDKPGGFYNPAIPNGGPMPSQPYNNYNSNNSRNSQINCIPVNRQPNQMWQQSRMMQQNCPSGSTSSSVGNIFNSDCHHSMSNNVPSSCNINDDNIMVESMSNNGGGLINNSSNPLSNTKLQLTSINCNVSDNSSSNNNNNSNSTSNSAITTALSLSQTLPSSIGNGRVSSAFSSSRDISSHISANISEFVPGQPWPGISYSQRDDSNVTLGAGPRSLLSITNDHLEKLTNSTVNSINGPNDVGNNSTVVNRLPNNMNGVCAGVNSRTNMTYVLMRDLPSHINIEMLKTVLTQHSFPGLLHMHPNLASRWVLLHFTSNEEALKAYKHLYNKVGIVELLPDQEVNQVIRGHRSNGIIIDHPMF